MERVEVDVLVVGGGACGLTASVMLSDAGIDHLVVERRSGTSDLPKAHYYNQRSMEIFQAHGMAGPIYDAGMPLANCTVRYITSYGGEGELDRKELLHFDTFGGGPRRVATQRAAAVPPTHLPQIGLEKILLELAQARGTRPVSFRHELQRFEQDDSGVTATIRDLLSDEIYEVRCKYMIASDGGRTVGPQLGIEREGRANLAVLVSAHISCDLSDYVPGDAMITHIIHPESRFRWGANVPVGPSWGKDCPQWQFSFAYHPSEEDRLTTDDIVPAIRQSMRLPNLDITLHKVNEWVAEATVAPRFRVGRVFLAGDSAHRVIPTSGLGLNSAIHDAHNLSWKLASVLNGSAGEQLLDSYEKERIPASHRNADWSYFTFVNHLYVEWSLGMLPGLPPEAHAQAIREFVADNDFGRMQRARAAEIAGTQRTEYGALAVELGDRYESHAVVSDGTPIPSVDPMGDVYAATTRPGHRLPHAWLEKGPTRVATHDLVGATERFVLITGGDGGAWIDAAEKAASAFGVEIRAIQVGIGAEWQDVSGLWDEAKGIEEDGAVLVRPDNFVGFRAISMPGDPTQGLIDALGTILDRSVRDRAPKSDTVKATLVN